MSATEEDDIIHTCNFCGAADTDETVECLLKGEDGTLICNMCVKRAEALLEDKQVEDIYLSHFKYEIDASTKGNLRPINKIPKRWLIFEAHIHKINPCVTACSPDGDEIETFSIPKQLAYWMISSEEEFDLDKIRKKIRRDLIDEVTTMLRQN